MEKSSKVVFISVISVMSLTLGGCSSVKERQERVWRVLDRGAETASGSVSILEQGWQAFWGTVARAITFGQHTANNVQHTVDGIEYRVQKVQKGVEKIQEGKKLLEEGLQK